MSFSAAPLVVAQSHFGLSALLREYPVLNGDPTYNISVHAFPISPEAIVESLIAPDGTPGTQIFGPGGLVVYAGNLSLPEAQTVFSGTWTFTERRGDELLSYEFTPPEITFDIFPEGPEIVSPMPQEIVGTCFLLDWQYPSGATPGGLGLSTSRFNLASIDATNHGNTTATITTELVPGATKAQVTLRVNNSMSQPLDITSISPGADARFSLNSITTHRHSLPLEVTVWIPEPTSLLLLAIGTSLTMIGRNRQR